MKINFKIFLGFLGGAIMLTTILSVVFYNDLFAILLRQRLVEKKQEIVLRREVILDVLDDFKSDVLFLSKLSTVEGYINTNDEEVRKEEKHELQEDFLNFSEKHKIYNQIRFIDEFGQEIVRVDWHPRKDKPEVILEDNLQDKKDRYYFRDTMKLLEDQVFVSLMELNIENGQIEKPYNPVIRYAVPVFDRNKNKKGVVVLNVFADYVLKGVHSNFLESSEFLKDKYDDVGSAVYAVDESGYFLHNSDQNKEWGFVFGNDETLLKYFPASAPKILSEEYGQFLDEESDNYFTYYRINPYGGGVASFHSGAHDHIIAEAESESEHIVEDNLDNYWVLVISMDHAKVLDRVSILLYKTMSLVFLIFVFFVIGMMWFFRRIVIEPIEKLRQGVSKIKSGNLDYKLDIIKKKDEIGELANEFNSMASVLKEYKDKMEQKVLDRTSDLDKFKLVVENTFDYVAITDAEGIILYVNKSVERVTGFTKSEVLGRKTGSKELWGGLMDKAFYENMWNTLKVEKKAFVSKIKNKRKNGEEYDALISITPVLNKKREILFFVAIERDILETGICE